MTEPGDPFAHAIKSERLRTVHGVWKGLAGGSMAPRRDQLTPAKLRTAMPWSFLVETAGADFRFGFAGDRIVQFMGRAHAGEMLSTLLGSPFYDGMNRFFTRCVAARMPLRAGPLRASLPGKEHLELEVIVLPLSEDGANVSALLGAFDTWRIGTHVSGG